MSHAAKALTHRTLRRRHLLGLIVLATLLLWTGLWSLAAWQFNRSLRHAIKDMRASGLSVTYSKRETGGSPLTVDILLRDFALESKSGARVKADRAVFYMDLWNWGAISAKLRDGVEGRLLNTSFKAAILKFGFEYPERAPLSYRETGLSLWVQPFALTLQTDKAPAFGDTIAEALFNVRVMGALPDFADKESVTAWNEASGVFEFDHFFLRWGPVTVMANGTVGLDVNLQPTGAFSGRIEGLDEGIDALARQGAITKRQESMVRTSVGVLSRPSSLTGSSTPIVPVSLQGGALYLGPVRLMNLPELKWE